MSDLPRSALLDEVLDADAGYSELGTIPIYGFLYDVRTGRLHDVPSATEAGQPLAWGTDRSAGQS